MLGMDNQPKKVIIDISWESLLRVVSLAILIWLIVLLKEVLIMLFVVFIFVAAVNPSVTRLQKYMSRALAATLFYVGLFAIISLLSYTMLPSLISQMNDLAHSIPGLLSSLKPYLQNMQTGDYSSILDQATNALTSALHSISGNLLATTIGFFGGMVTFITGLVLSFYLLLEEKNAREFFHQLLPQHRYEAVYNTVNKISDRMGNWVRGQVLLMLIIGVCNLICFDPLHRPYSGRDSRLWGGPRHRKRSQSSVGCADQLCSRSTARSSLYCS